MKITTRKYQNDHHINSVKNCAILFMYYASTPVNTDFTTDFLLHSKHISHY